MIELLFVHYTISCVLLGLVLYVGTTHYPAFSFIDRDRYAAFEDFHVRSTSWIVLPLILGEVGTGTWLFIQYEALRDSLPFGLALLFAWIPFFMSVFWSGPLHGKLRNGFSEKIHQELLWSHWIRTAFWLVRIGLLFYVLMKLGRGYF